MPSVGVPASQLPMRRREPRVRRCCALERPPRHPPAARRRLGVAGHADSYQGAGLGHAMDFREREPEAAVVLEHRIAQDRREARVAEHAHLIGIAAQDGGAVRPAGSIQVDAHAQRRARQRRQAEQAFGSRHRSDLQDRAVDFPLPCRSGRKPRRCPDAWRFRRMGMERNHDCQTPATIASCTHDQSHRCPPARAFRRA